MLLNPTQKGQIIAHFGQTASVLSQDNQILTIKLRQNLPPIVVGDLIEYQQNQNDYIISNLIPRKTSLKRGAKLVAANLTQLIIVIAPKPSPQFELIDRYLIACQTSQIKPLLVINKSDLTEFTANSLILEIKNLYQQLAINVLSVSSVSQHNFDELSQYLKNQTSAVVGQSGVGKTSIINALLPKQNSKVQELSSIIQGKHTTSVSQLFNLSNGGKLIDSPGVRSFILENLSQNQLNLAFAEISAQFKNCKFKNCSHQNEPNCAVQKALNCGLIHQKRWRSYLRILQTI